MDPDGDKFDAAAAKSVLRVGSPVERSSHSSRSNTRQSSTPANRKPTVVSSTIPAANRNAASREINNASSDNSKPPRHNSNLNRPLPKLKPETKKKAQNAPQQLTTQKAAGDGDSLIRMIARNSNRDKSNNADRAPHHADDHRQKDIMRNQLMGALMAGRKTEEDEYLEASSSDEEDIEAPWMEGSVIRTDYNQGAAQQPAPSAPQEPSLIDTSVARPDETVINAQTFIQVDTNIQSNDPKSEIPKPGKDEDEEEEKPIAKYGMLQGCLRDTHLKHGILYFSNIIFLFSWWIKLAQWNSNDCSGSYYDDDACSSFFGESPGLVLFVWVLMFGLFLLEFFCSSTGKYLRNINKTEDILDYMDRLYKTEPTLSIRIELYHYETRIVHYTDANGNHCTRTETYPVVTYTESEQVYITSWTDTSIPLEHAEIKEFEVTKVKVHKTFTADQNFVDQCEDLIARNRWRDLYYNFYTYFEIDGYRSRVLAFVDLDKRPKHLSFKWCLGAHLTLFPSLPYRVWMSSITGKVDTTVHKNICTTRSRSEALSSRNYPEGDEETGSTDEAGC